MCRTWNSWCSILRLNFRFRSFDVPYSSLLFSVQLGSISLRCSSHRELQSIRCHVLESGIVWWPTVFQKVLLLIHKVLLPIHHPFLLIHFTSLLFNVINFLLYKMVSLSFLAFNYLLSLRAKVSVFHIFRFL